jgi:hypothetical protein
MHRQAMQHILGRFNRSMALLIETNPALTKIARLELYAAIDTMTHNVLQYDREQQLQFKHVQTTVLDSIASMLTVVAGQKPTTNSTQAMKK